MGNEYSRTKTESQLIATLRMAVKTDNQKNIASSYGIAESYLCDILKGRRPIAEKLATAMGYKIERVYVPIAPTKTDTETRPRR